jgi:hypothetical protein
MSFFSTKQHYFTIFYFMLKSHQKYKLFPGIWPKVNKQKIRMFVLLYCFLMMVSCKNPQLKFYETDLAIMEKLQHYIKQEKLWAESIKQMDRTGANHHLDSMSIIIDHLSCFNSPEILPAQDTLYLQGLKNLLDEFETIADQKYPEIMEIALIPEPGYTTQSQKEMMLQLKEIDSIIQQKLNDFYTIRSSTLEKYKIVTIP